MAGEGLFIGQVARQAGTSPKTIRYYEEIGLLPVPQRSQNRYRLYSREVVGFLQFIRKAQGLGFALDEIKEIVELRRKGHEPCTHVRAVLETKITDLDQRLKDLATLRTKLRKLLVSSKKPSRQSKATAVVCRHIEGNHRAIPMEEFHR